MREGESNDRDNMGPHDGLAACWSNFNFLKNARHGRKRQGGGKTRVKVVKKAALKAVIEGLLSSLAL